MVPESLAHLLYDVGPIGAILRRTGRHLHGQIARSLDFFQDGPVASGPVHLCDDVP